MSALAEMYIQEVSTWKVKAITEELCGHAFSASAISAINQTLDESLKRFARRQILAVDVANRESQTSWKEVLRDLKSWGLRGVEFVVSDNHPGLTRYINGYRVAAPRRNRQATQV